MDATKERPSLSIHVKRTHKRPGSIVSGTVVPHMSRGRTLYVEKFTIHLVGRVEVARRKDRPSDVAGEQEDIIFLDLETPLDERAVRLQNWRVSPFLFTMPLDPHIENDKLRHWITRDRRPKPRSLPPSGELGNGILVGYSLEVTVKDDGCGDDIVAKLPLTFSNVRASDAPETDEQPISRVKTLEPPRDQPSLKLVMEFPGSAVQGEALSLTLRLMDTAPHAAAQGLPTLLLISCRLMLLEETSISIATPSETNHAKHHEVAFYNASPSKHGTLPSITEYGLDIAEVLDHPVISSAYIPTFDCAGIQRSYGLKALIRVQHDGQTSHEMEFLVNGLTLWSHETYAMAQATELKEDREDACLYPDEDEQGVF